MAIDSLCPRAPDDGFDGLYTHVALTAPLERRRLFVCGDALSLNQGWVLGALQSTAQVLDRV